MKQSPFKFLDAYGKDDKDIFFGREEEIESLYQMSFQTNLLLVYGISGTGKTSLVQCGLANKFDDSDWFEIFIRRKENINESFIAELKRCDKDGAFEKGFPPEQMVHSLYLDYLRPIYIIFDQFEELFILGSEEEQDSFTQNIKNLLKAELPCKIIFVMREEYLAHLSSFEKVVPQLFDKRLRVEPMNRNNAQRVILKTLKTERFGIQISNDDLADRIIDNVTEGVGRVQLTSLQVFLDKLYRVAQHRNEEHPYFDEALVQEVGRIDDVLRDFLDEQLEVFAQEVDTRELGLKWLKHFISEKETKMPVKRIDLERAMPELGKQKQISYLQFFVNHRILRPLDNDQYELIHDSMALKLAQTKAARIAIPLVLPEYELPENPFVRFEPFTKQIAELFFGRENEIKELFDKIVNDTDIRTTLVFGPIGVGKTSLIQAGLLPRLDILFKTSYLPCSRELFSEPVFQKMLLSDPEKGSNSLWLELAFPQIPCKQEERKIIIVDQLEELFIWIPEYEKLSHFYRHIDYLLKSGQNCDLVLVVRDEFFSHLQDLESFVPRILEKQMRIKSVDKIAAATILRKMASHAGLEIENEDVIDKILLNVSEGDGKVNLTYLQLYMDRLYRSS
jgi:Cdc6-like AAA superfamily ATPase